MFKIKNLNYKKIIDIQEIQIEERKINVIVVASGTGKTTFLKLLNKLISPTSGQIYYNDINLNNINLVEHRKNVLLLSQNPIVFKIT